MNNVVIIGGEKGGTGKSTLSVNLATMAALIGKDILVIDTDKQQTTSAFFQRRNEKEITPAIPCVHITGKYLYSEIENLAKKYEMILVDAGGRDSVELRSAMVAPSVEKLFSPLQPSEFDLDTCETLAELTTLARTYNPNLETYIVLNMCPTHSKIHSATEARESILDVFGETINISDIDLKHRIAYQYSLSYSKSVVEYEEERIKNSPKYQANNYLKKASEELINLFDEIFDENFLESLSNYNTERV